MLILVEHGKIYNLGARIRWKNTREAHVAIFQANRFTSRFMRFWYLSHWREEKMLRK